MNIKLPVLEYDYNALEPHIDAKTMEIHYSKHHQAYVNNLNAALEKFPEYQKYDLTKLLSEFNSLPEDLKNAVRNNGGGHANHSLFWKVLSPKQTQPSDKLKELLARDFGSFEKFKEIFETAAKTRFGSGWAWLVLDKNKKLSVISTPNQDSPLMDGLVPVLGLDVWEHAYYLNYQNRRPDYVAAFWNVVNWNEVEKNLN